MQLKKRYLAALVAAICVALGQAELVPVLTGLFTTVTETSMSLDR